MRRTLTLLVLGVLLSATACSTTTPVELGVFESTPEVLPFEGQPGDEVLLRHESGVEYPLVRDADGLRTPVLWDGAWEVLQGGAPRATFTIGTGPSGDLSFDSCWLDEPSDLRMRPEDVACLQSVAVEGRARVYGDVHRELDEALDRLDDLAPNGLRDWYCLLAGEMIAAAAVLDGQDTAGILSGFSSHCSFSLLHGTYMAKVAPGVDLTGVCDHRPEYPLAEVDHVSQCWNGIGIGLARLHRFDADHIFDACLLAPEIGALKNCFEGALNHFYNYRFRVRPGVWGPPVVDAAWCSLRSAALLASAEFQEVCYRVAVRGLLEETEPPMLPAERFVSSCEGLGVPARDGCMVAAGSLAARLIVDYRRPFDVVVASVGVCRISGTTVEAGVAAFDEPCLIRLFSGLVETPQSPYGFPPAELLEEVPAEHRAAVAGHFERWFVSITSVGSS